MRKARSWHVVAMVTAGLGTIASRGATCQEPPAGMELARAAAQVALEQSLATVQKSKNFELMGLRSKGESQQAALGRPMWVREIGYDKLVAYDKDSDTPASAFIELEQLKYPVVVGGEVRSSLTLVRDGAQWRLTTYGDAGRTREIEKSRLGLAAEVGRSGGDESSISLVSVPAFNLYFLAYTQDGKRLLRPVSVSLPPELEVEGPIEEEEMIARLSAYAKDFDNKYGDQIRQRRLVR